MFSHYNECKGGTVEQVDLISHRDLYEKFIKHYFVRDIFSYKALRNQINDISDIFTHLEKDTLYIYPFPRTHLPVT